MNEKDYNYLVERLIRPSLTPSARVRLPEEDIGWIRARASEQADTLREGPCHVIGDPAELVPADSSPGDHEPDPVDEVAVAASSIAALHAVMVDYAKFRKKQARKLAANASLATKATSSVRAMTFGTGFAILNSADRSWAAAKVAQLCLVAGLSHPVRVLAARFPIAGCDGWRPMTDLGNVTANHKDHVHISFRIVGGGTTYRR
ncbi:MAG: hypothetical protein WKF83_11530 [Nocardioidaceae bacterium]